MIADLIMPTNSLSIIIIIPVQLTDPGNVGVVFVFSEKLQTSLSLRIKEIKILELGAEDEYVKFILPRVRLRNSCYGSRICRKAILIRIITLRYRRLR